MVVSARHLPVRKLVGCILASNDLRGGLYSHESLADICNIFLVNTGQFVTEKHIKDSLAGGGDEWQHLSLESDLQLDAMGVLSFNKIRVQDDAGKRSTNYVAGC